MKARMRRQIEANLERHTQEMRCEHAASWSAKSRLSRVTAEHRTALAMNMFHYGAACALADVLGIEPPQLSDPGETL